MFYPDYNVPSCHISPPITIDKTQIEVLLPTVHSQFMMPESSIIACVPGHDTFNPDFEFTPTYLSSPAIYSVINNCIKPILCNIITHIMDKVRLVKQAKPRTIMQRYTIGCNSAVMVEAIVLMVIQHYLSLSMPILLLHKRSDIGSNSTTHRTKRSLLYRSRRFLGRFSDHTTSPISIFSI